jgi:hypothetical protein
MKKRSAMMAALASIVLFCRPELSGQANCSERRLVTELGQRVQAARGLSPSSRTLTLNAATTKVRYMRVRLERVDSGTCHDWLLVMRADDLRILETLTDADFAQAASRWTLRLPSRTIRISLAGCPMGGPTFKIDEHLEVPEKSDSRFFSAKDDVPDWKPLYEVPGQFREFGDSLGFFTSAWDRQVWVCSGVLLTDTLFITNWHCGGPTTVRAADGSEAPFRDDLRWNDVIRRDALVDLSWDEDAISQDYSVAAVAAQNPDLDYAVLRLVPLPTATRVPRVRLATAAVAEGTELILAHHPLGEPKQASFLACVADDVRRPGWRSGDITEFTHTCDSEGGSSGGPVFNTRGELIGLHHLGFTFASDCSSDKRNKAIHIGCILKDLPANIRNEIAPGRTFTCPSSR